MGLDPYGLPVIVDEVRLLSTLELRPHLQQLLTALLRALLWDPCATVCGGMCGATMCDGARRAAGRAIRLQTAQR